jgi:hypothetical protein
MYAWALLPNHLLLDEPAFEENISDDSQARMGSI